ncbi:hypothetical protein SUGI_0423090 [Cryptomeria japonica]|nr:hypothetical protein SUGI_0423090 [Cryptomeria japonica]
MTTVDRIKEIAIIIKWGGEKKGEGTSEDISKWWKRTYPDKVCIGPLQNECFLIECIDLYLKHEILNGSPSFYKGISFTKTNWTPNFDPRKFKINKTLKWFIVEGLPMEYWSGMAIMRIRDVLGSFSGVDKDFLNGKTGDVAKICVEIDMDMGTYNELEIVMKGGKCKQQIKSLDKNIPNRFLQWEKMQEGSSTLRKEQLRGIQEEISQGEMNSQSRHTEGGPLKRRRRENQSIEPMENSQERSIECQNNNPPSMQ